MTMYLLGLGTLPAVALAAVIVAWMVTRWSKRNLGIDRCKACDHAGYSSLAYEVWELNHWQTYWRTALHAIRLKRRAHREGWMIHAWPWVLRNVESGRTTQQSAERNRRRYGLPA